MNKPLILILLVGSFLVQPAWRSQAKEPEHAPAPAVSLSGALKRLQEGNKRFVEGKAQHPNQGAGRRAELSGSQHPFAIVLGCADSRTPPEVLFDAGLGDLFVIRVAGNVLNDEIIASMEYAVEHLGARLIVVMGHERCGAVKAARDTIAAQAQAPGHLQSLVQTLRPAVESTLKDDADATAKAHARNMVHTIRNSAPVLKKRNDKGEISVISAYYDLDSGAVTFLPETGAK